MPENKKYSFRKVLVIAVWFVLGSGIVVLLVAAITKKSNERITGVEIHISGYQGHLFIDKDEVLNILEKTNGGKFKNTALSTADLTGMEKRLGKVQWVNKAEIFFDNNNVMQVKVTVREPVARIFTVSGASFYIDSSLTRLPLSERFSALLPVFTDFPTDAKVLKESDSILLDQVKILSEYISSHPFWMAQIDQIDINSDNEFVLVPKLGNQIIRFGNANNYEEKFNKLLAFYKQVQSKIGWDRYSIIDVQYKGQVVGVKRDVSEIKANTLRTEQIMNNIAKEAQKDTDDSTRIQLPEPKQNNDQINNSPVLQEVPDETIKEEPVQKKQSSERNIGPVTPIHDPEKPIIENQLPTESKSVIRHPSSVEKPNPAPSEKVKKKKESSTVEKIKEKPKEKEKRVPKAVMPPKSNDEQ